MNNAQWCHLVCTACGLPGQFCNDAWTSARRMPAFFPDAVTLTPSPSISSLLDRVDSTSGCAIKDSFAALDLEPFDFRTLLEAQWIVAEQVEPTSTSLQSRWSNVTESGFTSWIEALNTSQGSESRLPASLLERDGVVVAARVEGSSIVGGAILNVSASAVGVSNVFSLSGDPTRIWAECIELAASRFPATPIVGYESGEALGAAQASGFQALGALRIWIKD